MKTIINVTLSFNTLMIQYTLNDKVTLIIQSTLNNKVTLMIQSTLNDKVTLMIVYIK
jgi:hypothetical protein